MIPGSPVGMALTGIGVHTLAMLVATGSVGMLVSEWLGVAFLRRGWINLDLLWTAGLIGAGCLPFVSLR